MKGDPRTAQYKEKEQEHLGQLAATGLGEATSATQHKPTLISMMTAGFLQQCNDFAWI